MPSARPRVPLLFFAAADIDALFAADITLGCSADEMLFCPNEPTARAEMAAFLHRALNRDN